MESHPDNDLNSNALTAQMHELRSALIDAFPTMPFPAEHRRKDGSIDWEVEDDVKKFLGKQWDDIGLEHWIRSVSPAAIRNSTNPLFFKYYLPSLLIGVFENPDFFPLALDALLPDNPKLEPRRAWTEFRSQFSPQQVAAVVMFLELLKEQVNFEDPVCRAANVGLGNLW
jgi:hypothetical protein